MSQSPNLPATRPTTDNYGPDLENSKPVKRPTKELDANNWNKAKADLAYVAQVVPLARAYVPNAGSVALASVVPFGTAPIAIVRNATGDVTLTYPTSVRIYSAGATSNTDGVSVVSCLFTPGGQTVRVKAAADCNFSLTVN